MELDAFGVFVASCTDIVPVCQMFLPQDKRKNDKALRASAQETSVIKSKVQDEASYLSFGEHNSMFYIIIIGGCEWLVCIKQLRLSDLPFSLLTFISSI